MLVSKTWYAKLKPRAVDYVQTRRTLHNLMKRQVIVDSGFLHDERWQRNDLVPTDMV